MDENDDNPWVCDCGKVCVSQRGLNQHRTRMHKNDKAIQEILPMNATAVPATQDMNPPSQSVSDIPELILPLKRPPENEVEISPKKKQATEPEKRLARWKSSPSQVIPASRFPFICL